MPLPRLLAALLVGALLALAPVPLALGQGTDAAATPSPRPGKTPPLTDQPQTSGGSASGAQHPSRRGAKQPRPPRKAGGADSGSTDPGGTPRSAVPRLPTTGAELPVVALLGLALVLLGIGLRLRTADARR